MLVAVVSIDQASTRGRAELLHRCVREVCSYIRTLATALQQKIIINFPVVAFFWRVQRLISLSEMFSLPAGLSSQTPH